MEKPANYDTKCPASDPLTPERCKTY